MGEPLKDIYGDMFLYDFGYKINAVYSNFNPNSFVTAVMDNNWDKLPLKSRMRRISEILRQYLPMGYEEALDVLFAIDKTCIGFPYLFFPDFVAVYGLSEEHWDLSIKALERFTQRSSSEFAIRVFLLRDPNRVMSRMMIWSKHPNEHVRRLASEGCRPRLPWGAAIPIFKSDPSPVLAILEQLKADPSLYVRKSVANNLNDISKDNPSVVLDTAQKWIGVHPYTDWILQKGCRTLIRKGNSEAMKLFGYTSFTDKVLIGTGASISVRPPKLKIGESCELQYELNIPKGDPVHIRIEYGIDFVKARRGNSRKLFLLSDKMITGGTHFSGIRTHNFKDLTTRRHYPGDHQITLLINGQEIARTILKIT